MPAKISAVRQRPYGSTAVLVPHTAPDYELSSDHSTVSMCVWFWWLLIMGRAAHLCAQLNCGVR